MGPDCFPHPGRHALLSGRDLCRPKAYLECTFWMSIIQREPQQTPRKPMSYKLLLVKLGAES